MAYNKVPGKKFLATVTACHAPYIVNCTYDLVLEIKDKHLSYYNHAPHGHLFRIEQVGYDNSQYTYRMCIVEPARGCN